MLHHPVLHVHLLFTLDPREGRHNLQHVLAKVTLCLGQLFTVDVTLLWPTADEEKYHLSHLLPRLADLGTLRDKCPEWGEAGAGRHHDDGCGECGRLEARTADACGGVVFWKD